MKWYEERRNRIRNGSARERRTEGEDEQEDEAGTEEAMSKSGAKKEEVKGAEDKTEGERGRG